MLRKESKKQKRTKLEKKMRYRRNGGTKEVGKDSRSLGRKGKKEE